MLSHEERIRLFVNWIDELIEKEIKPNLYSTSEREARIRAYGIAKRGITEVWFSELFKEKEAA